MTSAVEREPFKFPHSVPQAVVDAANDEAKLRIMAGWEDGRLAVAELMRKMLADGWKPDRKSVEELCTMIETPPRRD